MDVIMCIPPFSDVSMSAKFRINGSYDKFRRSDVLFM
jgi:hypothetical protein